MIYIFQTDTYLIGHLGNVVEPDDVKNKEDTEETVENVVDREHLDKLGKVIVMVKAKRSLTRPEQLL